jgi:putative transposase
MGRKIPYYGTTQSPFDPDDLLDQLLGGMDAASALNSPDWMNALKKALAERALSAEMDYHLGDEAEAENSRNGYGRKTVSTGTGKIDIEVPRDRTGSFDPQLIAKYQRRFPGFDDKIISMYARGMSTRRSPSICARFTAWMPRPT